MEFVARCNDAVLIRNQDRVEQEAWLMFSRPGMVVIVTDIHAKGGPHNTITFTAEELRRIADMIPAEGNDSATGAIHSDRKPI